jgi:pyrroloquinoline quinone (PQQ) biosynthesis protein C
MGTAFHDQLVTTRDKKHSRDHPFFELWAQGKLTKEQTAFY